MGAPAGEGDGAGGVEATQGRATVQFSVPALGGVGRWAVGGGWWAVGSGRWAVGSGQLGVWAEG